MEESVHQTGNWTLSSKSDFNREEVTSLKPCSTDPSPVRPLNCWMVFLKAEMGSETVRGSHVISPVLCRSPLTWSLEFKTAVKRKECTTLATSPQPRSLLTLGRRCTRKPGHTDGVTQYISVGTADSHTSRGQERLHTCEAGWAWPFRADTLE